MKAADPIIIPFQDMKSPYLELKSELDEAYQRFMDSGWYVLGKELEAFEQEYATYCEAAHCVGVASGLDALILALRALGIGEGDEVIVPSNTYIATWLAVSEVGAKPIPVEPDPLTHNIDAAQIESAITERTVALLPVNLYGAPFDYDTLLEIAQRHGLKLVTDNAQAQGARFKGRRVGGIADIECHSFYPTKNLGAFGEAGAITTNDPAIAEKVRLLRNYGSRVRYHHEIAGTNSRLDELQAAFLRVKLRHLDCWNARRASLAAVYREELCDTPSVTLPQEPEWASSVWHLYVIQHQRRDALQSYLLKKHGIQTLIHYPIPPHLSGVYANTHSVDLPIARQLAATVLSLPMSPHFSEMQVRQVAAAIRNFPEEA